MVDISLKPKGMRSAKAQGDIFVGTKVINMLNEGSMKKGNIITVAKVAGIMAAKSTGQIIPLCHSIPLDHIQVDVQSCLESGLMTVTATARAHHNTGVEMECLMAVTVALLTLYDMCKSVNKQMKISNVRLISKQKE